MSGQSKYQRYYTPLAGWVLVLPMKDDVISPLVKARLDAAGEIVGEGEYLSSIRKGVVVEKGKTMPGSISELKRRDVVLFPRGAGQVIRLKTQVEAGEYTEREFIVIREEEIVATV